MIKKKLSEETFKRLCGYRKTNLECQTPAEIEFSQHFHKWFPKIKLHAQKIMIKGCATGYLIDFFLPEYKIAIELDGGYHYEEIQIIRDLSRDNYLVKKGIKIVRLTNELVHKRHDKCIKLISQAIAEVTALKEIMQKVGQERKITGVLPEYTEADYKRDNRFKRGPKYRPLTMRRR